MKKAYTIETFQKIALDRGGVCLSKEYVNSKTKLKFKCKEGHEFLSQPGNLIYLKTWCQACARKAVGDKKRSTLFKIQKLAKANGGVLLSKSYHHNEEKLNWRCVKGHEFEMTAHNVNAGQWCSKCSGNKKHNLSLILELNKSKSGECLNKE